MRRWERIIFETMAAASSSIDLDAAIIGFLPLLDKGEKEALVNLLKSLVSVKDAAKHWEDPTFVAEMESRYEDHKKNPLKNAMLEQMLGDPNKISLDKEQKEAILNLIEAFSPPPGSHWDNPEFVAEMERRVEECRTGMATTYTIEEVMAGAHHIIADIRKKKKR